MLLTMVAVVAGVVGLAVGSFVNVVAHRVPLGLSVTRPPSACPGCGAEIGPRDNIPVVSWLLLGGKCRACGMGIGVRYPLVELATAGLWAATPYVVGLTAMLPAYLWFFSVTIALVATDLEHHRLPNRIVLHGTWVGLLLLAGGALLGGSEPVRIGHAITGGAAWFALMLAIALVARGGFGFGDVKVAFLLGAFVSFQPGLADAEWFDALGSVGVAIVGSFLIGGVVAIGLMVSRRTDRRAEMAFGPAMIAASWIAVVWGDRLLAAWLG